MATVSNEQFLFSAINHSNNGTVNWTAVAEECGIVSKGAAAIKFNRMKAKFGTVSKDATAPAADKDTAADGDTEETPKKAKKKTPAKKAGPKKRKLNDEAEETEVKGEAEDEDA